MSAFDIRSVVIEHSSIERVFEAAKTGKYDKYHASSNAHVHIPFNFSAFESAEKAAQQAQKERVGVLGVTSYYDYSLSYQKFAAACVKYRIFPLFGMEIMLMDETLRERGVLINDPANPGKMYFCGKSAMLFTDPRDPSAHVILESIRSKDGARMAQMVEQINAHAARAAAPLDLDVTQIRRSVAEAGGFPDEVVVLQERHLAQAVQEAIFEKYAEARSRKQALERIFGAALQLEAVPENAVAIQNEARSHLMKAGKPAFVKEDYISVEEGIRFVLHMGAIPCYPVLADGAKQIGGFEGPVDGLIEHLRERRVHCVEFIPERNELTTLEAYVPALRAAGIVAVAGTEHNTKDMIPLAPRCKDGPISDRVQRIFWEGTCVIAAHSFLTAYGRCGYVDGTGALNPDFKGQEERIAELARIGRAALGDYLTNLRAAADSRVSG